MGWKKTDIKYIEVEEHPTRLNGINPDKRFRIRFDWNGKKCGGGMGYESKYQPVKGCPTLLEYTKQKLAYYRMNARDNNGKPTSRVEEREQAEVEKRAKKRAEAKKKVEGMTLNRYWEEVFKPKVEPKSTKDAWNSRRQHFECWISPVCGDARIKDLDGDDIDDIVTAMEEGIPLVDDRRIQTGQRSGTTNYKVWATFKKIITYVHDHDYEMYPAAGQIFTKDNRPKKNGAMKRALAPVELETILDELTKISDDAWYITLFCARTGVRFSEAARIQERHIFLTKDRNWVHIPWGKTEAAIRDITLPDDLIPVLKERMSGKQWNLVFQNRRGDDPNSPRKKPPKAFKTAVERMALNRNVQDHEVITFKALRRTFATRLLHIPGYSRQDVMTVMGWNTPAMAEHYDQGNLEAQEQAAQAVADMHKVDPDRSLVVTDLDDERKKRRA